MKQFLSLLFTVIVLSYMFFACSKEKDIPYKIVDQPTDYASSDNWAKNAGTNGRWPVDVFYLYPTVFKGPELVAEVSNPQMRAALPIIQTRQVAVYADSCNIFIPYYRQMNADSMLIKSLDEQDVLMRRYAVVDAIAAFNYYWEHYNNGRPFILAGHSQGSNLALYILETLQNRPEIRSKLVAAYVVGYSVSDSWMQKLPTTPFGQNYNDTGVILSWNTEAPGVTKPNPVITDSSVRVINPIIWTTNTTYAPKELSKGSKFLENGVMVEYPQYADAQVYPERCVILLTSQDYTDYQLTPLFPKGVLHGFDYDLYHNDIKQNVADRITAYQKK